MGRYISFESASGVIFIKKPKKCIERLKKSKKIPAEKQGSLIFK